MLENKSVTVLENESERLLENKSEELLDDKSAKLLDIEEGDPPQCRPAQCAPPSPVRASHARVDCPTPQVKGCWVHRGRYRDPPRAKRDPV